MMLVWDLNNLDFPLLINTNLTTRVPLSSYVRGPFIALGCQCATEKPRLRLTLAIGGSHDTLDLVVAAWGY